MKHVVLSTVAGLASVAGAQTVTLSIVPSATVVSPGVTSSFTLSVYATADFGTAIAGGEFALTANGGDGVNEMTGAAASWGAGFQNDRGHTGAGNHAGLVFGQLIFPPVLPPHPDSVLANGLVLLGVMTVSIDADTDESSIQWTTTAGQGAFVLEVYDDADGSFTQVTSVVHGSATVYLPSSGGLCVLGLGGLVATRRRR